MGFSNYEKAIFIRQIVDLAKILSLLSSLPFKRALSTSVIGLDFKSPKIIDYSMLRIFMCRILGTWKLKPLMKTIHSVTYLTLLFNYQRPFAWVIFRNVNNLICIWNKSIYKLKCKRKILLDFDGMIYKMVLVFFTDKNTVHSYKVLSN